MYLRYIFFHPNWDSSSIKEYNQTILQRFQYNCNFISHYLSLSVRKKRFLTDGTFNSIGVYFSFSDQVMNFDKVGWKSLHDLHCSLIVSSEAFEQYLHEHNLEKRYEFYLSCLERGYAFINQHKAIPLDLLMGLNDEFRKIGYKNEVVFKKINIPLFGLRIVLTQVLSTIDFKLVISAFDSKTSTLIAEGTVFRTMPDEIFYRHHFKQVIVENNQLLILDFLDRPSFGVDLSALCEGKVLIKYTGTSFNEEIQAEENKRIESLIW